MSKFFFKCHHHPSRFKIKNIFKVWKFYFSYIKFQKSHVLFVWEVYLYIYFIFVMRNFIPTAIRLRRSLKPYVCWPKLPWTISLNCTLVKELCNDHTSYFLIAISLKPDGVIHWYFKLKNIGPTLIHSLKYQHQVAML